MYAIRSYYDQSGDWRDYSVSAADLEALVHVLDGSAAMFINVNRASDISRVIELAADYGVRVVVRNNFV